MPTNLPNTAASQTSGQQPIPAGGNQPPWRKTASLLLAALLAVLLVAFGLWLATSKIKPKPPAAPEASPTAKVEEIKIVATVVSVDTPAKVVKVRDSGSGQIYTVLVEAETKLVRAKDQSAVELTVLKTGTLLSIWAQKVGPGPFRAVQITVQDPQLFLPGSGS